jgi:TetR/AcrR family transcriptional repressor of nem operon
MVGRNPSYDLDKVLEKGIYLFWHKGFNAVTINDIVNETGINRFSFYEKFGSKEEFFQASLDTYYHVLTKQYLSEMREENPGLVAILNFLRKMSAIAADPDLPQGCLVINSVMELNQNRFNLDRRFNEIKGAQFTAMLNSLNTEKNKGTLKNEKSPEELASYLSDETMSGLATSRLSRDVASRLFGYQVEIVNAW